MRTAVIALAIVVVVAIAVVLIVMTFFPTQRETGGPEGGLVVTGEVSEEEALNILEEEMDQQLENITMEDIKEASLVQ